MPIFDPNKKPTDPMECLIQHDVQQLDYIQFDDLSNQAFTAHKIAIEHVVSPIMAVQKLPEPTRANVARGIVSNMQSSNELFLDYAPKKMHDTLKVQLAFWLKPKEQIAANTIAKMLNNYEVIYQINDYKQMNEYDHFSDADKVFIDIKLGALPYIQEYVRHQTKQTRTFIPDPSLTNPTVRKNFEEYREIAFLEWELPALFSRIDTHRRNPIVVRSKDPISTEIINTDENNKDCMGVDNDKVAKQRAEDLYQILIGNRSVNEIAKVLFRDQLSKKL